MANNFPVVSVIIPVYNVASYLRECLDSLVNQTLAELEFIYINDGSTDDSLRILNEYAAKDNRFVIISQENQGQGAARNRGIEIARGEYIAFVDPDDWVDLNTFEVSYNEAKKTGVDIVHFDYYKFDGAKNKIRINSFKDNFKRMSFKPLKDGNFYSRKDFSKPDWLCNLSLSVWNKIIKGVLFKRTILNSLRINLPKIIFLALQVLYWRIKFYI